MKCSGDFDTAYSNWFDNSVSTLHMLWEKFGIHWSQAMEWVLFEGDDNISSTRGLMWANKDFEPYGMTAKVEVFSDIEDAGFCQKYVGKDGCLLMDPLRYLSRAQHIPRKYACSKLSKKLALMKAKAMSTLAYSPNCPVVAEHAWRVYSQLTKIHVSQKMLDGNRGFNGQRLDESDGNVKTSRFKPPVVSADDRIKVSILFGFSLAKQETFTQAMSTWNVSSHLNIPLEWFPVEWLEYWNEYVAYKENEITTARRNIGFINHWVGVIRNHRVTTSVFNRRPVFS